MTTPENPSFGYPTLRAALEGVADGQIIGATVFTSDGSQIYSFGELEERLTELTKDDFVFAMSKDVANQILAELLEDSSEDLDSPPDFMGLPI